MQSRSELVCGVFIAYAHEILLGVVRVFCDPREFLDFVYPLGCRLPRLTGLAHILILHGT
jgi:hypothetical protein